MKRKVLILAGYHGIRPVVHSVSRDFPDLLLEVHTELFDQTKATEIHLFRGVSAVLAQGKAYRQLSSWAIPCPVVELPLTHYDLLSAGKLAQGYSGKTILLTDPSFAPTAEELVDLAALSLAVHPLENAMDEQTVKLLQSQGYSLAITTPENSSICRSFGLNTMILTTNYRTLNQYLHLVESFLKNPKRLESGLTLLEDYMAEEETSYLAFDTTGAPQFELNPPLHPKLLAVAQSLVPEVVADTKTHKLRMIAGRSFIFKGRLLKGNKSPLVMFEIKYSLENTKTTLPGIMIKNTENLSKDFYNVFYDDLRNPDFRSKVVAYSKTTSPVVVIGESGTGKSRLANFIYDSSPFRENLFFVIDCKQLDRRGIHYLFRSLESPFYERETTLYFKELNLLKKKHIDELVEFLRQSPSMKGNKIIFSITCSVEESYDNRLCELLVSQLGSFPLYLVPLRERVADISNLAVLYLNQLNQTLGKNLSGFEPEAMAYLQGFDWNENIKQFKRVLHQIYLLTQGSYISTKETISILREESIRFKPKETPPLLTQQQPLTLEALTHQAVQQAMLASGMNQTMAAKQLGISRTTLWRILKA